jgi:hypothetical protein
MNPLPNPSAGKTATPSETSGKWVVIPVPTAASTGSSPGDVPVNMIAGLSELQTFNTASLAPGKFSTIEVVLDAAIPGFVVPLCAGGNLEGCARYPIQLQNASSSLQFVFPPDSRFQIVEGETKLLPILLSATVVSTPSGAGQPYIVHVGVSNPSNIFAYLGAITGTITGSKGSEVVNHVHLKMNAELAGTNTLVASSDVLNGKYTLFLPAAASPLGTLYDFYLAGGETTMIAQRGLQSSTTGSTPAPLLPSPAATATIDLTVKGSQTIGGFSGQVTDSCTTLPISGVTLQILLPPNDNTSINCAKTPAQCISVATATTDSGGNYPVPGTVFNPAPFEQIPIGSPTATYVLEISAPGYDTLFMGGTAAPGGSSGGVAAGHCFTPTTSPTSTATPANGTCNFPLTTAYMQGKVNLSAAQPPGANTTVQVFAEDSGTNNLVSALTTPLTIPGGGTNLGFTLNVPSHAFNSSGPATYDLFAEAQDLYQGGTDPFPGHTIIVQQGVSGPPKACATITPGLFTEAMECVGHGSISGIAANNPNSGTTIGLTKNGVAITDSAVALLAPTATASASYSFCIPPDSYSLQRFAQGTPVGTTAAVGPMATPEPTNSPCPSTCFSGSGICPGICAGTTGPTM